MTAAPCGGEKGKEWETDTVWADWLVAQAVSGFYSL